MGLRSDAGLLAEEYNPKTYGLMGSFPQPFSHVALETMAVDISRQRGLPSGDRDRALHTSLFRLSSSDGSGLYLGLCTRICKNMHSTRLSGRRLFSLRRPPKQHILARMADKPGPRCGNGAPRAE